MLKEIVLLTKSKKYNGYCVAGIDIQEGKWVRLMEQGEHSVSPETFKYPDGLEPAILDCIQVNVIDQCGTTLQPENVYFETTSLRFDGNYGADDVIAERVEQDYGSHDYVFHNKYPKLLDKMLPSEAIDNPYSLMIVEPEKVKIVKDSYGKVVANFTWKGKKYNNFRVTDTDFINQTFADNEITSIEVDNPVYMVISLGESFTNPNSGAIEYYKLIASIIDKEQEKPESEPEGKGEDNGNNEGDVFSGNKYEKAKSILETIACGNNPYTGAYIAEDSVLNEKDTIRSLFIAVQALDTMIVGGAKAKKKKGKVPFTLLPSDAETIVLSEKPLPITNITAIINDAAETEKMKKLSYKVVLQWLMDNGFIVEKDIEGKAVRYPTEKGIDLGISVEKRIPSSGEVHYVTVYNKEAQRFIVDNVNIMVESSL